VLTEAESFCVTVLHSGGVVRTLNFDTSEQARYACGRMAQRLAEQRGEKGAPA